jgi:hypothetical protein
LLVDDLAARISDLQLDSYVSVRRKLGHWIQLATAEARKTAERSRWIVAEATKFAESSAFLHASAVFPRRPVRYLGLASLRAMGSCPWSAAENRAEKPPSLASPYRC